MAEMTKKKRRGTTWCSALYCSNNKRKMENLHFFRFPKNPIRSKQWVIACGRNDLANKSVEYLYNNCRLCVVHFEKKCFVNFYLKNRLEESAVPSIFHAKPKLVLEENSANINDNFVGMHRLLIKHAKQVVTVCKNGETLLKGTSMNDVCVMNGPVSIVVDSDGNIGYIDEDVVVSQKFGDKNFETILDATDMCVIPGLVDGHTHPVFAGDRVHEFAMKLAGASYMEVHKAGGGIHFTVDHVHKATEDELFLNLKEILPRMLRAGTTLLEAKSGYGLDTENEIKMLKVLERANKEGPIEISSTYCGAHAVPRGLTAAEATSDIINKQIPMLKSLMDIGELHVDNIDVFCEKNVFELGDTERILKAGKDIGLAINFHAEELNQLNSVELGVSLGARAISHLEEISDEGIKMMAASSSVGVVLPTTAYILKLKPPPVRKMIEQGAAVSLGTDFNPNAFCLSMPLVMHLACVTFGMTMNEALVASTINSASSIGRSRSHGSLEVGKVADMLILDCPRWEHLIYQFGGHGHVIKHVIKKGRLVHSRNNDQ